jgi:hypothetical protein
MDDKLDSRSKETTMAYFNVSVPGNLMEGLKEITKTSVCVVLYYKFRILNLHLLLVFFCLHRNIFLYTK